MIRNYLSSRKLERLKQINRKKGHKQPIKDLPPASSQCSSVQHSAQSHHLIDLCTQISGIFALPANIQKYQSNHKAPNRFPKVFSQKCLLCTLVIKHLVEHPDHHLFRPCTQHLERPLKWTFQPALPNIKYAEMWEMPR
jgi:hypothetical protein